MVFSSKRGMLLRVCWSTQSRSTSVKTDVSLTDISSLPSSVCSAGDMPQPDHQPKPGDYESAMGEIMLQSAGLTSAVELDVEVVGHSPETEAQEDSVKEKRREETRFSIYLSLVSSNEETLQII